MQIKVSPERGMVQKQNWGEAIYVKVNVCWMLVAGGQRPLIIVRENSGGELAFGLFPYDRVGKSMTEN